VPAVHHQRIRDHADTLSSRSAAPHATLVILQKFLRANEGRLPEAKAQLLAALRWRKEYNPLAVKEEVFSKTKFGGLGYITKVKGAKLGLQDSINSEDVVVFNIYGAAASNNRETFGDKDAYVRAAYSPVEQPELTNIQVRALEGRVDGIDNRAPRLAKHHFADSRLRPGPRPAPGTPGTRLPKRQLFPPTRRDQASQHRDHRPVPALLSRDRQLQVLCQRAVTYAMDDGCDEGSYV
jgi:hypothetical protein